MAAAHLVEIIALDVYTTTIITTKTPISIFVPVPLTDVWDTGETLAHFDLGYAERDQPTAAAVAWLRSKG